MNTSRLEKVGNDAMNEGRGASRVLIWVVALTMGCLVSCSILSGCAAIKREIGPIVIGGVIDWSTNRTDKAESPDTPSHVDAVPFDKLVWKYGGFNGAGADFDQVTLSNASCNGKRYAYTFAVGMSAWGIAHGDAGHTICAVFVEQDGGQWVGGKFDWVSTSRTFRDLHHVESYNNWPSSGWKLPLRGKVAFVIVHKDRARRSNVIMAEAR